MHTSAIIVNEQLIVYPEICDVRKMIMNVFQCMGAKPIIAMVGAGLGITLLPETALQ
ncbi:transcriptional regulator LysR family [Bacillus cereus]|nr:transcriptional regulator LysR family [Bacillus cereus]